MHPKRDENPHAKRPTVKDKDHDAMIQKAWKAGWWARQTGKGKVFCYPPDGGDPVLVASTPSDKARSIRNHRRLFAQRGLKV